MELYADKRVSVSIEIDEKDILADMKKRMFNQNDIATVMDKIKKRNYNATFIPELFDGFEGTVILYVDGYDFYIPAEEVR